MPRVKKEEQVEKKPRKKAKPIQTVKGMKDILPPEQFIWDYILHNSRKICQDFGFGRIETPILENTDLFKRGVGQATDIVEKEMFSFETQGGDNVTMRPEGTAGVVRSYIENGMSRWSQPVRLYYEGSMFRYDKPQQGRFREFHQFGAEVFGEEGSAIDAQIIYLAWKIFQKLGLRDVSIQINSIGCPTCRNKYKKLLTDYYDMKINKLCVDCKRRLEKNPMRLLDCKEEKCLQVAAGAPQIIDNLCDDCNTHFKSVLEFLDELEIPYVLNPSLVRGLDYYTRTVFEIWADGDEGESRQAALGGGGRYDGLVELLGGEPTPAVGFSFGVERVADKVMKMGLDLEPKVVKDVFLVQLGDMARKKVMKIFDKLVDNNILVGESLGKGSIKSQLRTANKVRAKLALIVGQKEAIDGTVIIRDMDSGMQETVILENIVEDVRRMLKG
ncbi:MAG: histidine--tRNA ligase [Candidatus Pacebacteria bacterium]|nr:histidine--tRNA ligase [Candidatus Paceibacterota bacterium]